MGFRFNGNKQTWGGKPVTVPTTWGGKPITGSAYGTTTFSNTGVTHTPAPTPDPTPFKLSLDKFKESAAEQDKWFDPNISGQYTTQYDTMKKAGKEHLDYVNSLFSQATPASSAYQEAQKNIEGFKAEQIAQLEKDKVDQASQLANANAATMRAAGSQAATAGFSPFGAASAAQVQQGQMQAGQQTNAFNSRFADQRQGVLSQYNNAKMQSQENEVNRLNEAHKGKLALLADASKTMSGTEINFANAIINRLHGIEMAKLGLMSSKELAEQQATFDIESATAAAEAATPKAMNSDELDLMWKTKAATAADLHRRFSGWLNDKLQEVKGATLTKAQKDSANIWIKKYVYEHDGNMPTKTQVANGIGIDVDDLNRNSSSWD